MQRKRNIATFCLALTAFLAVGAGVVLAVAPDQPPAGGARAVVRAATAAASAEPAGEPSPAATTAPSPQVEGFALVPNLPAIPRPDQPGRIVIPSITLDARVTEVGLVVENGKPAWETAAFAVGFHRGTALPGTRGNTVMAGHISSPVSKKGDIFRRLPEVRIGDRMDIYVGERRVSYEVAEVKVVPPTAVQVMNPTADASLTLITCYPNGIYNKRLIVVGRLLDQAG